MVYNLTKIATPSDNFNPESRSVLATYTSAKRIIYHTMESLSFTYTANVRFKLRISQNGK